jgi:TonB-dependent starch-binding outer membrane protein SusC
MNRMHNPNNMSKSVQFRNSILQILLGIWNVRAHGFALCLSFLFLLMSLVVSAQDRTVTGSVKDENGENLPGVNIVLKGTTQGTITGGNGDYTISVPDNAILIFSFLGYKQQEVAVGERSTIEIRLESDVSLLEEIVVVGYGTQKRADLTGSVVSMGSEKLTERPVVNLEQAMAGQLAGVEISPRNAAPGQQSNIIIRGVGSISAGFGPLFVVDGFPTDQNLANALNPADIASVDILKDASATAIYGSRGANGVILITTKSGKEGKPTFNFSSTVGVANVNENDFFDMLNAEEYVQYMTEAAQNNGAPVRAPVQNWDGVTDTNWQKEVFQSAPYQNYSLSATGGTGKTNYSMSFGYIDQEGILKGTSFTKYSVRARVDFRPVDKLRIGVNIAPNYNVANNMPDGDFTNPFAAAVFMPPIIPVRMPDGTYGDTQKFPGVADIQIANPLQIIELYEDQTRSLLNLINTDLEYEIVDGLRFRTSFGITTSNIVNETYSPSTLAPLPRNPTATYRSDDYLNWLNENTLSYSKAFDDHSLNVVAGITTQKQESTFVRMSANSFPTNGVETLNGGTVLPAASNTSKSAWSLLSYLARANYDYKGKYFLTATIRRDGSSRFGANERYGTFPSGAVAWKISEESFMKGVSFVSNAKIRASYGKTGNNAIADFASIGLLNTVNQPFGLGTGSNNVGLTVTSPSNPNLTWEIANQVDIGVDLSLVKNRFNLTFDYYNKTTESLLLNVNVPSTTGYQGVFTNIGKMRTKGIELTANFQILDGPFKWNVGGNLATMDQEVLALGPDGSPIIGFFGTLVTSVGGQLEEGRGLVSDGILSQSDIDNGHPLFGASKAGDYKFQDVNGDGFVDGFNQADGQLLGSPNNKIIYGITSSISYKNFDFSFLIQGQDGGSLYDLYYQLGGIGGGNGINTNSFYYDGRYISEDDPGDGKTPRAGYFGAGTPNNYYQQSTAFTRIRNITLGYNIPQKVFEKTSIKSLRAFISADNLATFTTFLGGNPNTTRTGNGSRAQSDGRFLGLNSIPSLPLPRTYSLGLTINF